MANPKKLRKTLSDVKPHDTLELLFRYDAVKNFEALLQGAGRKPWLLENGALERYRELSALGLWIEEETRKVKIEILPGFAPRAFEQEFGSALQRTPMICRNHPGE